MTSLLSAAGRAFLRAFAGALIILLPGVLAAPDLNAARALGVAAFLASLVAGIRAIQAYAPQFTIAQYIGAQVGAYVDSFLRAFLATFLTMITGALQAPNLSTGKSLAVAALIGAVTAGVRALQAFFTTGQSPSAGIGIKDPPLAHELPPGPPAA
jgi:hypothetical protein